MDEDKLHNAIVAALNQYGAVRADVIEDTLELVGVAQSHNVGGGLSLLALQDRLKKLSAEQRPFCWIRCWRIWTIQR